MGIRIHKVLGYGLDNLKGTKLEDDPRFKVNTDDFYNKVCEDFDMNKFLTWARGKGEKYCRQLVRQEHVAKDESDVDLFYSWLVHDIDLGIKENVDCRVEYNPEYGLDNVILFVPPYKTHRRYDDLIDYYVEGANSDCRNYVTDLTNRCGIYPHQMMVRIREPKNPDVNKQWSEATVEGKNALRGRLEPAIYNRLTGRWDSKSRAVATGDFLEHLVNDWRPTIPEVVLAFVKYLDIFEDPTEVTKEFKPMIYTYWG